MTSYLTSHCMNPRQRSAPLEGRQSGGYSPTARLRFPTGGEQNLGEGPFPSPRRLRRGGRRTLDIRASIMLGWFHYIKVFPIVNRVCRFFSPSLEFFCSSLQNSRRGGSLAPIAAAWDRLVGARPRFARLRSFCGGKAAAKTIEAPSGEEPTRLRLSPSAMAGKGGAASAAPPENGGEGGSIPA